MGVAAIGPCDKDISTTISMPLHKEVPHKNVQIGNDKEMAQSERNSHSTQFQVDRPSTLVAQTCCDLFEIVDDDGRRRGTVTGSCLYYKLTLSLRMFTITMV